MAIQYVGRGGTDGVTISDDLTLSGTVTMDGTSVTIGDASTVLVGFYGATPVDQPALVADATDASTAITQINAIIDLLQEVGLMATA